MKYMMVIKYDGSKFYGFQRQKNVRNVQGYLEEEISNALGEKVLIKGAGRTDRGVHAYCQVIHFETIKKIKGLKKILNKRLVDLKVKKIKKASNIFHARHSVKNKIYLYKIDLSNKRDKNYYLSMNYKLDLKNMRLASNMFLGTHNFKNFVAGERIDYVGTIINIKIYRFNKILYLKFKGIGFYRYMVRNLVGALIEVGKGKVNRSIIKEMINHPEIEKRLPTSSPNGLYLLKINY
ncbi:MAG: tRNA pseudouridine(38-40) synthase TruA [Firmicutes bacterium]|nr:tRNA pseudouridine(38-40) synthase TruA [Bacillota bacterium]